MLAVRQARETRKGVWVALGLLLAIAFVVAGLLAGNKGEGHRSRNRAATSASRRVTEAEFREGWNHAAGEEQREREDNPTGESKWEELAH